MLPSEIQKELGYIIQQQIGLAPVLSEIRSVGGGCINDARVVKTDQGFYFLKYNHGSRYPGMFEAETRGLKMLEDANEIRVPKVISTGTAGKHDFLVLEYLESGRQEKHFWEHFGRGLARLHNHTAQHFGLDHENYIGSLPQTNAFSESWKDFFMTQRIEPQLRLSRQSGKTDAQLDTLFEQFFVRLDAFFPKEPPALVHGDLWSGNFLTGPNGEAVIIDPAVYFGHRYMDLGMTQLFGGFDPAFYKAYQEEYPLQDNWRDGLEIAKLYPLMVHVNLFGGGYLGSVRQILRQYA
ncbi:MAG: fructosamine kinase family protein [Bacteroides sp.]|jgi:fructosamine-3-kinase|nr:fructosamine kinase family protein [Bacteroides sp.]